MQPGNENILAVEACPTAFGGEDGSLNAVARRACRARASTNWLCLLMHKGDKEQIFSSNSLYSEVSRRYAAAVEAALSQSMQKLVKPPAGPRMLARARRGS